MKPVRIGTATLLAAAALVAVHSSPASAETRTYVRSWFGQAMDSVANDCPEGVNPAWSEQRLKVVADLGYSKQEIDAMVQAEITDGKHGAQLEDLIETRGRVDGKPTNPYTFPGTVKDPKLHWAKGKYAYGFNLDGRGAASLNGFEDPETHEKGVNNELARALGCMREFRGSLTTSPLYWDWTWGQLKDNEPAWLIVIEGADLNKDGPVTVTVERAVEHLKSNTDGSPTRDATYRVDPDPRSHNVYHAKLVGGVVTLDEPNPRDIRMLQDPLVAMEFRLKNVHMRLKAQSDNTLEVIVGGYQSWGDLYYSFADGGSGNESASTGDLPGIFYLFKRFADAEPDATGQNANISAAYYIQAVPAFAVPAQSKDSTIAAR